jgi:hypothetical protein
MSTARGAPWADRNVRWLMAGGKRVPGFAFAVDCAMPHPASGALPVCRALGAWLFTPMRRIGASAG